MYETYILSSFDEWKSWSSMSLIMASTSIRKIKGKIVKQIKEGNIEYKRGNQNLSKTAQIKMLREEYKKHGEKFVFDNPEYGFVNDVADGERQ